MSNVLKVGSIDRSEIAYYVDYGIKNLFKYDTNKGTYEFADLVQALKNEKDLKEVTKFLLRHPNKSVMVDGLCEQLKLTQTKHRIKLDKAELQWFVKQSVRVFARLCIEREEARLLSDNERIRRVDDENAMDNLEAELEDDANWAKERKLNPRVGYTKGK